MPDHFHGILEVMRPMARPLGNAIGGFKTGCEKIWRRFAPEGAGRLWAEGFQDTVLLHAGQLGHMFHYLADNARRLALKLLFPNLFRVVTEMAVALRLAPPEPPTLRHEPPALRLAPPEPPTLRLAPQAQNEPCDALSCADGASHRLGDGASRRLGDGASRRLGAAVGHFSALGNRFLLTRALVQVQVSRRHFGYRREPKPGGGLKIARDAQGEPLVAFATAEYEARRAAVFAPMRRRLTDFASGSSAKGPRPSTTTALAPPTSMRWPAPPRA